MNGKGSKPRPFTKFSKFQDNFDDINWSYSTKNKIDVALDGYKERKKPTLKGMSVINYEKLVKSGMFWEWYPDATGNYTKDCD